MKPTELKSGDVVQIRPDIDDGVFGGALMIVTEPKSWGAQGAVHGLGKGQAYYRCNFKDMEFIGHAAWVIEGAEKGKE